LRPNTPERLAPPVSAPDVLWLCSAAIGPALVYGKIIVFALEDVQIDVCWVCSCWLVEMVFYSMWN